jgi:hypothetical protein
MPKSASVKRREYVVFTNNVLTYYNYVSGGGLWCLATLSTTIFQYIVAVSFIGGGNRSTRRKSPTCRQSLTNFIA